MDSYFIAHFEWIVMVLCGHGVLSSYSTRFGNISLELSSTPLYLGCCISSMPCGNATSTPQLGEQGGSGSGRMSMFSCRTIGGCRRRRHRHGPWSMVDGRWSMVDIMVVKLRERFLAGEIAAGKWRRRAQGSSRRTKLVLLSRDREFTYYSFVSRLIQINLTMS